MLLTVAFPLALHSYVSNPATAERAIMLCNGIIAGAPLLFVYGTLTSALRALGQAGSAARATVIGLGVGAICTATLMSATPFTLFAEPLLGIAIGLAVGYLFAKCAGAE